MSFATSKNGLFAASVQGLSFLVGIQFVSRLTTFVVNQLTLRLTSPESYGIASIQLELFMQTVLILSREGFRTALQRNAVGSNQAQLAHKVQKTINTAYIASALGILLSIVLCGSYIFLAPQETRQSEYFRTCTVLYASAATLESLAEPYYAFADLSMLYNIRARAEAANVIAHGLATFLVSLYASQNRLNIGALPFALGELVGHGSYYLVFMYTVQRQLGSQDRAFRFLPQAVSSKGVLQYVERPEIKLALSFTSQNLFKHLLTEGDKIMVSQYANNRHQGVYAFISNYGSLVCRIVFLPIEQTARNLFAKLFADRKHDQAILVLFGVMRVYFIFGLFVLSFGPPLADTGLHVIAGPRFQSREALQILQAYIFYLPVLAFNGILESYVASVASVRDLKIQSYVMLACSVLFFLLSRLFLSAYQMGTDGLILANICCLGVRVIWCMYFVKRSARASPFRLALPTFSTISAFVPVAFTLYRYKETFDTRTPTSLGIAVSFACILLTIWY